MDKFITNNTNTPGRSLRSSSFANNKQSFTFSQKCSYKEKGSAGKMAPSKKAPREHDDEDDDISLATSEEMVRHNIHHDSPLTYADMTEIAADIKNSFSTAITDLKADILMLTEQMSTNERAGRRRDRAIARIDTIIDSHSLHLITMNRQLEDLDNRGRRNNIRVRGVPESITTEQIRPALTSIFNNLTDRPAESPIEFDRAHRALKPKPPEEAPPRDIICHLPNFTLKEEILQRARQNDAIIFNDKEILLFQDLSPITLKNRRALKPLLEVLKEKNISYRWKFPFALQATFQGKHFFLRTPDDLTTFYENLHMEYIPLPDWYAEFINPQIPNQETSPSSSSPLSSPNSNGKQNRKLNHNGKHSPAAKASRTREHY